MARNPNEADALFREMIVEYLACGVGTVWVVDPYIRTVQVHRPETAPKMCNVEQTLSGGDVLPGLEIAVADLFPKAP